VIWQPQYRILTIQLFVRRKRPCDQRVCMSVCHCLSVHSRISKTICTKFMEFSIRAGGEFFTRDNVMRYPSPRALHADAAVPLSPLLIFLLVKRRSTKSQCFSMGRKTPKNTPSGAVSRPQSNTLFLGPTPVYSPTGIVISSAVFARLKNVTNRQTDRQHAIPSVAIGAFYARSARDVA